MSNKVYSMSDLGLAEITPVESKTVDSEIYSDISMRSVKNSAEKNRIEKLVDVEAVKNAVKNIFTFLPGERVLEPTFGNKLYELLYSPINTFTQEQIILEIKTMFSLWESRAVLDGITDLTTLDDKENNTMRYKIVWHVVGFESFPQELYV